MSTATKAPPLILSSREVAERTGISSANLIALFRKYRFEFTELVPGGKPGDHGRHRWGLTEKQLQTLIAAQARQFQPEPEKEVEARRAASYPTPDGISRLRRKKPR